MKKVIAIIAVALSLTGCAAIDKVQTVISAAQKFEITQGQLDSARSSYNGFVLAPLRKYALLPRCKTGQTLTLNNPCHDRKLLKQIREVDEQIEKTFADTQSRIISGDNSGAVAAYSSLTNLIDIARTLIAQTGVSVLGV